MLASNIAKLLNEKVEHQGVIHTGVYLNTHGNTAIVVKVKNATVHCLHMVNGSIQVESMPVFRFAREWPAKLPNYPTQRALRGYRNSGLRIDETAERIIRAVLG